MSEESGFERTAYESAQDAAQLHRRIAAVVLRSRPVATSRTDGITFLHGRRRDDRLGTPYERRAGGERRARYPQREVATEVEPASEGRSS